MMRAAAFLILMLLTALPVPPAAAEMTAADPVAMQRAAERGKTAAAAADWPLAIRYFSEARAAAPHLPENLFNLALAHHQAGHPLIAAAWFRAYLEALPESDKHAQIEMILEEIDVKSEIKARELRRITEETLPKFPDSRAAARQQGYGWLAYAYAQGGEIEAADAAARKTPVRATAEDFRQYYGQVLARAHDYAGVARMLDGIQDPERRNLVLYALADSQMQRDEDDRLVPTVARMSPSETRRRFLTGWMIHWTRALRNDDARRILTLAGTPEENAHLAQILMAGYLKAGDHEAARALAREVRTRGREAGLAPEDLRTARLVGGEGKRVLEEVRDLPVNPEAPWEKAEALSSAAIHLAWMGDLKAAQEGCAAMDRFADEFPQPAVRDFVGITCSYVRAEAGEMPDAVARLEELSPGTQRHFRLSLFWRLVALDRLEAAAELALGAEDARDQARLFHALAHVWQARGGDAAAVWREKARDAAVRANAAYVLKQMAIEAAEAGDPAEAEALFRAERLARWIGVAEYFSGKESLADLEGFLKKAGDADLLETVRLLTAASLEWEEARGYLHGVETWHAQNR